MTERSAVDGLGSRREKQAYDLILGDAGKVFDLSQEKDELRDRYGRNTFGQSCLVARRLVETRRALTSPSTTAAGTRTRRISRPCAETAGAGQGPGHPARRTCRTAACWTARSSGGAANSAARPRSHWEAALERRPRPLGQGLLGRGGRRRLQGRPRGRRVRRQGRRGQGPARLSVRPDRQHVRAAGHRPDGKLPHPAGPEWSA